MIIKLKEIQKMQTIICMKWGVICYKFVNNLFFSIRKTYKKKTQLICFTDDSNKYTKNVICKPLPKIKIS